MKQGEPNKKANVKGIDSDKNAGKQGKRKINYTILVALAALTFILYGNTISHDYALDDDIITRVNHYVQEGISGIPHIFKKGFLYGFNGRNDQSYRPITLTSIAIEKSIWGNNPHVHHFFNVFLYAVTGIFLFLLLLIIFQKYHFTVPLIITLLFIAHPIHTEVVANIKSRDEILSFLFCILTLFFASRYYLEKEPPYNKYLSWFCYFLALLSKEHILTFVVIIPLVFYFFGSFSINKLFKITLPYVAVAGIYMLIRGSVLDTITFSAPMEVINNSLMAAHSGIDKFATTIYTLGKYVWLLFFPLVLSWDYSYNQIPIVKVINYHFLVPALLYTGMGIYAIKTFKQKDPVSFGILYFMITMLLVSNLLISIGSSMGERFLYTSSLGFCISIFFVLLKAAKKIEDKNIRNNVLYVVMGLIIAAYCFKTITRNEDWENNLTLFESGIITAPNSARAHEAYAYETGRRSLESHNPGERDSLFRLSMIHYNDALSIMPAYSEALYNKGYQNLAAGNLDSAQVALKNCLRADPNYTAALNDLGVVYFNQKLFRDGLTCFFNVLSTDINNSEALGNIGACYHNMGKLDSAVYYYRKALDINPGMDNIKANLVKAENELKNGSTKP